ncbi:MAG TPA: hypothetical protein VE548_07770 [Nitrososphaeraceae archaeon]|jgi:hypothetical protein|nr:hypothetical protein [Nitrososphaeraceae archaeon]
MNQDVSDTELEDARHEMSYCFGQIKNLEPWARGICEDKSNDEVFSYKLMDNREIDQWDAQFRKLLLRTIQAQVKYIELLERRIGK